MHFIPATLALATTLLSITPSVSGLVLPRDTGVPSVPNPFNIVVVNTKDSSYKKKLYVPPTSADHAVVFPRVDKDASLYSKFIYNGNKTISVAGSSLLLYALDSGEGQSQVSLVASPFTTEAGYTLLTNSVAESKTSAGKSETFLTLGAAEFRSFRDIGLWGFTAEKNGVRTGGDDAGDDIEQFQFIVVPDGANAADVVVE